MKPLINRGFKPDEAQQQWLFEQTAKEKERAADPNPCVRIYGADPVGRKCKECRLLRREEIRSGRAFFKCALRGSTRGPGTDHRAGWNACVKFVSAPQRERKTAGKAVCRW